VEFVVSRSSSDFWFLTPDFSLSGLPEKSGIPFTQFITHIIFAYPISDFFATGRSGRGRRALGYG